MRLIVVSQLVLSQFIFTTQWIVKSPSKVRNCAVAPPDHLRSESSFPSTCNIPRSKK